ncbi:MAG: hypothetical protein FWH22_05280 [Fibromonadales bacterium]|nr:hypothetical protein [Fibromonadales bacterium]
MDSAEFDRRIAAIMESLEKSRLEDERRTAKSMAEFERRTAEFERRTEEFERSKAEFDRRMAKIDDKIDYAKEDIAGISNSNGLVAEDYFFNSLEKTLTLGGKHFDHAQKGGRRSLKLSNGKKLTGQYDTLLINDNSIAVVEIKYKAEKEDVEKLAGKQLENFRILYPEFAKYKIYLGIAGLSVDEHAEKEALKRGIAVLKQKGDAIEILDGNLRAY